MRKLRFKINPDRQILKVSVSVSNMKKWFHATCNYTFVGRKRDVMQLIQTQASADFSLEDSNDIFRQAINVFQCE